MLPACRAPSAPAPPRPERRAGLPFAHREAYAAYFARLAAHPDARAALRRLITHLDADLDGDERLALWQALWRVPQRLSPADRARGGRPAWTAATPLRWRRWTGPGTTRP
jgi:hypothetical protein